MITANRPSDGNPSRIREEFVATGDAMAALAERTAQVDRLVLEAASTLLLPAVKCDIAVLAVGGYGRRQLFPYSDIDVLLLFPSDKQAMESKAAISAFLQHLWDAGLRMSHSVRTPAECCEVHDGNTELNVSLLDQRYLTGDRVLYAGLADRLPRFVQANRDALVRNLARLTRDRHAKYGDTFYHLEPNVKDTPGGLRDYQLVCWLDQIREGAADPAPELRDAFRFLARLRCYLHCISNRDNNQLSFDAQDSLAEHWHLEDTAQWMREYYRHSRAIYRAAIRALETGEAVSSSLFTQFRDFRSRASTAEFSVHRERVHFKTPQRLEVDPELVLRLFEFVGRHGVRLSGEAEQRIDARLPRLRDHFAAPQDLWPAIQQIFSTPRAPLAARAMHENGVLTAIFPEFEQVECLVVRDFYHRYTVDEHTLVTLQELWELRSAEEAPLRSFRDLLAEIKEPGLLAFALLFHDSGKGTPGEGHVTASARLASGAMSRIHMPAQDREMVLFLINKHLELSAAMHSRDMADPQTIRDVAHQMATVERLKTLTLLTYADISAVYPGCMTPWRAEQLWQLYLKVYNELTRELQTERIDESVPSGSPERAAFLQGFPMRYLRTHSDSEIGEHIALEAKSRARGIAVDIRRLDSAWQLTLIAQDRPGLFASVAGTLSCFGMNILKVEAFSNRRSLVLDTFTFADAGRTLDLNPTEVDRLRATVEKVLTGKADVRELLRNRPKPVLPSRKARIPARVNFDSEASGSATLIEIVAEDRPGLLYDVATAITATGGNIEVVLIDTQAHKAIDVFYVTADGVKLTPEKQEIMGEALRQACQPAS
uniref:Bifunctional uridylyltransferase/uridylyl-removing enzyme n=1 Tax=Solibacter usitatus (strain Ellin6076) TaxID=234267 RepID=Q01QH1_SOLUE